MSETPPALIAIACLVPYGITLCLIAVAQFFTTMVLSETIQTGHKFTSWLPANVIFTACLMALHLGVHVLFTNRGTLYVDLDCVSVVLAFIPLVAPLSFQQEQNGIPMMLLLGIWLECCAVWSGEGGYFGFFEAACAAEARETTARRRR